MAEAVSVADDLVGSDSLAFVLEAVIAAAEAFRIVRRRPDVEGSGAIRHLDRYVDYLDEQAAHLRQVLVAAGPVESDAGRLRALILHATECDDWRTVRELAGQLAALDDSE